MAEQQFHIIDDRSSGDLQATSGSEWHMVTDNVMGGISKGQLTLGEKANRHCLRMQGDVKLDNNGGFVQVALDLPADYMQDITTYTGIMLEVYGNDEQYNIHLRTHDIWLPWQSYRAAFIAASKWQTHYFPFTEFEPYRINKPLNIARLKRIGLVAIGREFNADLCFAKLAFYR